MCGCVFLDETEYFLQFLGPSRSTCNPLLVGFGIKNGTGGRVLFIGALAAKEASHGICKKRERWVNQTWSKGWNEEASKGQQGKQRQRKRAGCCWPPWYRRQEVKEQRQGEKRKKKNSTPALLCEMKRTCVSSLAMETAYLQAISQKDGKGQI